ncbi:tRNA uridine-5-carboxymethylaminomethyl(34) synthesis GTPase MnmE [Brevundimonas sp. 2R-24]|uniref:tRNA modification GTPase MnmE n=1 Tax=Peiella sedimenti TaxID=3061083 RepID=A0ABT8SKK8_9CAUL|nr:tRNA uridine-5-carboxymethylaminomethyl(34) synthesis GTPase MnmE [Caulobacteraceae bacterium XZ-24]
MRDTIFALATAPGRAALAVIRLSGPAAWEAAAALGATNLEPRQAHLRKLLEPNGEGLDEALVVGFRGPASFTGEDVVELHLHGGPAVVHAVTRALLGQGLRAAEPGEFARRAFEAGRLDLTQAEGIADLIDAESDAQRRQALGQLDGAMAGRAAAWRADLVRILARLEAAIDFPDEALPEDLASSMGGPISDLAQRLRQALSEGARGEAVRDGFQVALVGPPNAGKSTLFNGLLERDAAIVTDIPGTTRDVLEGALNLGGYRVVLFDTAGLRDTHDVVEAEGVRRARLRAETAHLRLHLRDGRTAETVDTGPADWWVRTRADMTGTRASGPRVFDTAPGPEGVAGLRQALAAHVAQSLSGSEFPAVTRARHARRLSMAIEALEQAGAALSIGPELAAEDVRAAAAALDGLTGRIGVEDVLDEVFSSFCIGK